MQNIQTHPNCTEVVIQELVQTAQNNSYVRTRIDCTTTLPEMEGNLDKLFNLKSVLHCQCILTDATHFTEVVIQGLVLTTQNSSCVCTKIDFTTTLPEMEGQK